MVLGRALINYTREDQQEFDRIFKVFGDYLKQSTHVDVVPSKVGYVIIPIEEGEMSCGVLAEVIETPADLCNLCITEMAHDILDELAPPRPNLYECSEELKQRILTRIAPYMKELPEYRYLEEKLFITPHENCG